MALQYFTAQDISDLRFIVPISEVTPSPVLTRTDWAEIKPVLHWLGANSCTGYMAPRYQRQGMIYRTPPGEPLELIAAGTTKDLTFIREEVLCNPFLIEDRTSGRYRIQQSAPDTWMLTRLKKGTEEKHPKGRDISLLLVSADRVRTL